MNKIKELRQKNQISQTKLAKVLNVHQTAISQWEQERTSPDMEMLAKIADYFGVTTDYVLGREETTVHNEQPLSEDELEYLRLIEILTDDERKKLIDYAELLKRGRNQ